MSAVVRGMLLTMYRRNTKVIQAIITKNGRKNAWEQKFWLNFFDYSPRSFMASSSDPVVAWR